MLLTKKKFKKFVFIYSRVLPFAVLLPDIFYLYMAHSTSINIDLFFFPSNLKDPEMGISFRRTWNWNENNTCWCSCLVPRHITQPGCSCALGGLWCFLHLGNFSLPFFFFFKALPWQGLVHFGVCRYPTALIPTGRIRLDLRRGLAHHSPTSFLVFVPPPNKPGDEVSWSWSKVPKVSVVALM